MIYIFCSGYPLKPQNHSCVKPMEVLLYLSRWSGHRKCCVNMEKEARGPVLSTEPVWGRAQMDDVNDDIRSYSRCILKCATWCFMQLDKNLKITGRVKYCNCPPLHKRNILMWQVQSASRTWSIFVKYKKVWPTLLSVCSISSSKL